MKKIEFESHSREATAQIAYEFASSLDCGDIIRLHGDIGVGKTVFVSGVARYFGCEDVVCSPTFAIMNIYSGSKKIYHFDLYRLESADELYEAGLFEFIGGDGISVVEWPDVADEYTGRKIYDVYIEKNLDLGEDFRKIIIAEENDESTCD